MTRLITLLVVLLAVTWTLMGLFGSAEVAPHAQNTVTLGFVILAAHALGLVFSRLGFPAITAHMLLGLAAGPHGLALITVESIENLSLIDGVALALIALTAGGELILDQLRPAFRTIATLTVSLTVLIFGAAGLTTWLMLGLLPDSGPLEGNAALAFCLLMGVMAVALSPSATIAVITETRAQGRLTDVILGVTVLLDVLVIVLFAAIFAFSQSLVSPGAPAIFQDMGHLLLRLLFSVGAGLGLAALLALALPRSGKQIPLLIAGFSLVVAAGAPIADLNPLILCIATGFVVRNFTPRGREMIRGIESISPLFYAIFFTIVAAGLDLNALGRVWPVVLALMLGRGLATWIATWLGSGVMKDPSAMRRVGWLGFISQAGVSLGLATVVASAFGEWGATFETVVISLTAGNLLIGPILLKLALVKAGEAGNTDTGKANHC